MKNEKPHQYLIPYSKLGKWSIVFIILFGLSLIAFYLLVDSGQRGREGGFFGNLWLATPLTLAAIFGIASFVVGLFAVIKQKELSIFVGICIFIGLIVLLLTSVFILPFE